MDHCLRARRSHVRRDCRFASRYDTIRSLQGKIGAAVANDLSSAPRIRGQTSCPVVVRFTEDIFGSVMTNIGMTLVFEPLCLFFPSRSAECRRWLSPLGRRKIPGSA